MHDIHCSKCGAAMRFRDTHCPRCQVRNATGQAGDENYKIPRQFPGRAMREAKSSSGKAKKGAG